MLVAFVVVDPPPEPTVEVVIWTNGHLLRDGTGLRLLRQMANEFNAARHRTPDGDLIVVEVYYNKSARQASDLLSRILWGRPENRDLPDPTIVTPSASQRLILVNFDAGYNVVDLVNSRSIAKTYIGIATHRAMAECLGWPDKEIGFEEIIALKSNPDGWRSFSCAKAAWGPEPKMAITNPNTSSTGLSILYTLYSIAVGTPPEQLTPEGISDSAVVKYVKDFQKLVDLYEIGTDELNTSIHEGPRKVHFALIPEDNLINLIDGNVTIFKNGREIDGPPLPYDMVMLYPKEGSMVRNNIAGIVQAPWVDEEEKAAANMWIDYLLEDEQQRDFMRAGFRPVTDLPIDDPSSKINGKYGLDPKTPAIVRDPAYLDPKVAAAIIESWDDVKLPGIVVIVIDASGSMMGEKLEQAIQGLNELIDKMAKNNQMGLIIFSDEIRTVIPVGPVDENKFAFADAMEEVRAGGETALNDAIKLAIEMVDEVDGDPDAIRGVVVLTDGQANKGLARLHDLANMTSKGERDITEFPDSGPAIDVDGIGVPRSEVIGESLKLKIRHPNMKVFYIGVGDDADMDVGRILSQATGAAFRGVTEEDLAKVIQAFSEYFGG